MKVLGLDHVQVAMPPEQEAVARLFYGQTLGLVEMPKQGETVARGGVWFQCGSQQLHLGVEKEFHPAKKAHPALLVKDYGTLLQVLRQAGYEVVEDFSIPGITRSFTFDPFGNRIELVACEDAL